MAPHFPGAHARLVARGTLVAGTSGPSQMVHAPSPDWWPGPRPLQGNEEAPRPLRTHALTGAAMQRGRAPGPQEPPATSQGARAEEGKEGLGAPSPPPPPPPAL